MNGRRVVTTAIGPTAALLCGTDSAAATVFVPRDADLNRAILDARPGDTITLQPRATYVGNFPLPGDGDIAALGDGGGAQRTLAQVPHDIVIDRCYIHGQPSVGAKRCVALNSAATTVSDSYISDSVEAIHRSRNRDCRWRPATLPGRKPVSSSAQFRAQFVRYAELDFRLVAASPWRRAGLDRRDLGTDG